MVIRVLLVLILLVGGYLLIRRSRRFSGWAYLLQRLLAAGILVVLILLTLRGGAELTLPLLAILAPFLMRWLQPSSLSSPATSAPPGQGQSAINTRFLHMVLDHATGVMSGRVREGRFAGCGLQELSLSDYLALWRECRVDPQSMAVLEAYLDRHADPTWRDQLADHAPPHPDHARMSLTEAYEILGLRVGASREEIQAAYRRLIQRLHPDQGGSAYLAACLNGARDLLLGQTDKY